MAFFTSFIVEFVGGDPDEKLVAGMESLFTRQKVAYLAANASSLGFFNPNFV